MWQRSNIFKFVPAKHIAFLNLFRKGESYSGACGRVLDWNVNYSVQVTRDSSRVIQGASLRLFFRKNRRRDIKG